MRPEPEHRFVGITGSGVSLLLPEMSVTRRWHLSSSRMPPSLIQGHVPKNLAGFLLPLSRGQRKRLSPPESRFFLLVGAKFLTVRDLAHVNARSNCLDPKHAII